MMQKWRKPHSGFGDTVSKPIVDATREETSSARENWPLLSKMHVCCALRGQVGVGEGGARG